MVEDLLVAEDTEVSMSAINLGEVLYIVHRSFGEQAATLVETKVLDTPKVKVMEASWVRVRAAAKVKAGGGISFADCFGAALAEEMDATLVTSDADFRRLEADGRISIVWLS
jgi:predicted nucleic acid-binding protein